MHRCRRFTAGLTVGDARLEGKRGRLLLSFRGTFTRYPSTSSPGAPSAAGIVVKCRRNRGQMRQDFAANRHIRENTWSEKRPDGRWRA